jgi:hypothetical protein
MLHDYLHCLVFKEQSVYRLSFQATHLSYRIQLSLSTSFLENFQSFCGRPKTRYHSRFAGLFACHVCQRLVL